jgi:hypothetical protein
MACVVALLLSSAGAAGVQADTSAAQGEPARLKSAAGTWKVSAQVGDTAVRMTCVIADKERKLSGTCVVDQDDDSGAARALSGEATEKGVAWHFDARYEGKPVTVSMRAVLDEAGTKMYGTVEVPQLDANGTFLAEKEGTDAKGSDSK